jgi:hypothetical protein
MNKFSYFFFLFSFFLEMVMSFDDQDWQIYYVKHKTMGFLALNVTFNNISAISSWWSFLLVEETWETTDLPQVTEKR